MSITKTDCTLQFEITECGAASLSIILKYYKKFVPLAELRSVCSVSRDGASLKKLVDGAHHYGLNTKALRKTAAELKTAPKCPSILWWKRNHFLVYEGYSAGYYFLSDPAEGRRTVSEQDFCNSYSGVCVELNPTDKFEPSGSPANPWLSLFPFFLRYKLYFIFTFIFSILQILPIIAYAGCSQEFVNQFLTQGRVYFGLPIIWILASAVLIDASLTWLSLILFRRLELVVTRDIVLSVYAKIVTTDYAYFSQRLTGELANRISISFSLPQILIVQFFQFSITATKALLISLVALIISPQLVFMVFTILFANMFLSFVIIKRQKDVARLQAFSLGMSSGVTMQAINQIESIKSSGSEFSTLNLWQESFSKYVDSSQKIGSLGAFSSASSHGSNFLLKILTLIFGGILIIRGDLSLGSLIAFQLLENQISAPIQQIPQLTRTWQNFVGILARIDDVFDSPVDPYSQQTLSVPAIPETTSPDPSSSSVPLQSIALHKVSFSYDGSSDYLLNDISFSFEKGKHYALVGGSGSGKSTLIRLIAGLVQPNTGSILYNDSPWAVSSTNFIRSHLRYVPQEPFIFNATIKDNITLFDPEVSDDLVWSAINASNLVNDISRYPDTIYHKLRDNGSDLSGGQRQRLELARALCALPSFLILDEATSSLDVDSESIVLENVLSKGITVLSAAHRLTSALKSDSVLVLDSGSIAEAGSPDQLLANPSSLFAQLVHFEQPVPLR